MERMFDRIEEYNAYLKDNYYNTNRGYGESDVSFNVKMHDLWVDSDWVQEHLIERGITGDDFTKVIEEFNDTRLEGIYSHYLESTAESFIEEIAEKSSPYYYLLDADVVGFYGRNGGHLCLGKQSYFQVDLADGETGYYPIWIWNQKEDTYWTFSKETLVKDFMEYYEITNQKELMKSLRDDMKKGDLANYYKIAIENQELFEQLEAQIQSFKETAKANLKQQVIYEIEQFINEEFGIELIIAAAEKGDYSKLNTIVEIKNAYVLTNLKAKVPLKAVKQILKTLKKGSDVIGQSIGNFTINDTVRGMNDIYVKIGCHVFSLNQTLKQIPV